MASAPLIEIILARYQRMPEHKAPDWIQFEYK